MTEDAILQLKNKSIIDYLEKSGFEFIRMGSKMMCSSPFSNDSTPSFVVYPTNTFYDWSNGIYGDIIDLVQRIEGIDFRNACKFLSDDEYVLDIKKEPIVIEKKKPFRVSKYVNFSPKENVKIDQYARSRGIIYGYVPGKFHELENDVWVKRLAMMFIHTDYDGNICGAKLRLIVNRKERRFTARGLMQYYVLDNVLDENPTIYLAESETSANSLWMVLRSLGKSSVVICFGSVSAPPERLPKKYESYKNRKLIIDYDGSEDKYQYRISMFAHLNAEPIKMELNKGEDINSLYSTGQLSTIMQYL